MDSPVRLQLKRDDYTRHKLFRKIKRRLKAKREQEKKLAEKELRRKFRIPKYSRGKSSDDVVYETQNTEDGTVYRIHPSAFGAKELNVTTPEVVVKANPDDVARGRAERWFRDFGTESNDATSVASGRRQNSHLDEWGIEGAAKAAAWMKDNPVLNNVGLGLSTIPLAVAATPAVVGGGELAATALANPYVDAGLKSYFGAHGLQSLANGTADWTTALEIAPLGRLVKPLWNAGKEGLQYAVKAADNATRYMSPSYDLYRTIGETTPRTTPTYHGFYSSDLTGSGFVENVYTGSPLFEFGQTMRTSPEKAYFMRAPKDVDVLKLENGKFRHEVVGNEILPSGEVNGKFVSYGEPWQEFALGENSALYEFPVGPRRGPSLMATDWKGRGQKYSVDEVYDYMQQEEALRKELASIKETMGDDFLKQYSTIRRNLINEKYPALKEPIDTSIHGANQTVIPNERWNFDKFLKTPFWKYSENPISGQVQKELMMRWPEAKPLETPTISWQQATKPLSAKDIFLDNKGHGWLQQTADRLGININHYYNNIITPEELKAINASYLNVPIPESFIEPRYIGAGYPYGLDKAKILMPYDKIREMSIMAPYKDLPEQEFRKVADDLIGSHEFIHWWNQQLRKNLNAGIMPVPKGYQSGDLTWLGANQASGMSIPEMGNLEEYFTSANATETNARTGQLFNAFGLEKGKLAPQHINLAKKYYTEVFPDNQMSTFLKAIIDKDAFVEWANKNAGTKFGLLPFLGLGTAGTLLSASQLGYKHGKAPGIHIKPENRGKFTALKKRTGHSASWFKAHGTPALKKMATFALNARKWKKK